MNQALENEKARAHSLFVGLNPDVKEILEGALDKMVASSFTAGEKAGREAAVEVIKKSRTVNEKYGVGINEKNARAQAIADILAALKADTSDRVNNK